MHTAMYVYAQVFAHIHADVESCMPEHTHTHNFMKRVHAHGCFWTYLFGCVQKLYLPASACVSSEGWDHAGLSASTCTGMCLRVCPSLYLSLQASCVAYLSICVHTRKHVPTNCQRNVYLCVRKAVLLVQANMQNLNMHMHAHTHTYTDIRVHTRSYTNARCVQRISVLTEPGEEPHVPENASMGLVAERVHSLNQSMLQGQQATKQLVVFASVSAHSSETQVVLGRHQQHLEHW